MAQKNRTDAAVTWQAGRIALRCAAALMLVDGAAAQTPPPALDSTGDVLRIAANDNTLWLAHIEGRKTTLFRRSALDELKRIHSLNGRVVLMAAIDDDALVVLDDNSIFRYADAGQPPARELDLPGRERPLQLLAVGRTVYALIPSTLARRLEAAGGTTTAPATRPFEPGEATLSVASYDGRRWSGLAACPPVVTGGDNGSLRPLLTVANGELMLLWAAPPQVHFVRLDPQSGAWRSGGSIGVPGLTGFWSSGVSGAPTLVAVGDSPDAAPDSASPPAPAPPARVSAYRLLPEGGVFAWQRGELRASPLPADVGSAEVVAAFGFNQHVGLLARDAQGQPFLQFARFGEDPIEPTVRLRDTLGPQRDALPFEAPLQVLMLLAVLGVFTTLVLFRRASITRPVALPRGHALAFTTQRLVAWLIDFLPFMLVAAATVGVNWMESLRHVFGWAINAHSESGLPGAERLRIATWWGLSVGGYTLYCLVMELIAGRTVGKLLLGVRLLSETGQRLRTMQVIIRNASRLLELMPPLWVLGFLALLTRNRQRVGDIFARTVAVRRVSDEPGGEKPREERVKDESRDE